MHSIPELSELLFTMKLAFCEQTGKYPTQAFISVEDAQGIRSYEGFMPRADHSLCSAWGMAVFPGDFRSGAPIITAD